jgi:hypothetical protein
MTKAVYNEYSETVRQQPQNYLLTSKAAGGRWMLDSDPEADIELMLATARTLGIGVNKYISGRGLAALVNARYKVFLFRAHRYKFPPPPTKHIGWTESNWITYIDKNGVWL